MADDLVEQCSKLSLLNEESHVIELDDNGGYRSDEKLSLRLVGRILTEKPLNFDAVKRMLLHIWSLREGVIIRIWAQICFFWLGCITSLLGGDLRKGYALSRNR